MYSLYDTGLSALANGVLWLSENKNDNASWFFDLHPQNVERQKEIVYCDSASRCDRCLDWITNEAKKSFLQHAAVIRRIYNWIDIDRFIPKIQIYARSIKSRMKNC